MLSLPTRDWACIAGVGAHRAPELAPRDRACWKQRASSTSSQTISHPPYPCDTALKPANEHCIAPPSHAPCDGNERSSQCSEVLKFSKCLKPNIPLNTATSIPSQQFSSCQTLPGQPSPGDPGPHRPQLQGRSSAGRWPAGTGAQGAAGPSDTEAAGIRLAWAGAGGWWSEAPAPGRWQSHPVLLGRKPP